MTCRLGGGQEAVAKSSLLCQMLHGIGRLPLQRRRCALELCAAQTRVDFHGKATIFVQTRKPICAGVSLARVRTRAGMHVCPSHRCSTIKYGQLRQCCPLDPGMPPAWRTHPSRPSSACARPSVLARREPVYWVSLLLPSCVRSSCCDPALAVSSGPWVLCSRPCCLIAGECQRASCAVTASFSLSSGTFTIPLCVQMHARHPSLPSHRPRRSRSYLPLAAMVLLVFLMLSAWTADPHDLRQRVTTQLEQLKTQVAGLAGGNGEVCADAHGCRFLLIESIGAMAAFLSRRRSS